MSDRAAGRFDAAAFCMALACAPRGEWPDLIGDDPRRQRIADHLAAVAAQAPTPGPQQRAIVRAVFKQRKMIPHDR